MGIGWNTFKDPFKGIPVVGGALEAVYDSLPVDNVIRMGEDISRGNWGSAATNLGIGALETAALFLPGSGLLAKSAGKPVAQVGLKTVAKQLAGKQGKAALTTAGKYLVREAGPSKVGVAFRALDNYFGPKPASAAAAPAAGTGPGAFRTMDQKLSQPAASAANFRMAEEASMKKYLESERKKRLAAGGGAGTGAGSGTGATVAGNAPVAAPKDLDSILGALSPDQLDQVATKRRELQSQYDLLNAAFTRQTAEGRAAQEEADMMARNVAAGESQNLATNLANIGMDLSPGAAIVGGEGISNTQVQQQAQANRTLAELLGQIEAGRAKQQSDYSLGLTQLEKLKQLMRIQNTMDQQRAAYDQLGGA
jgi:hypothetical protein